MALTRNFRQIPKTKQSDITPAWENTDTAPDRDASEAAFEWLDRLDPSKVGAMLEAWNDTPFLRFSPEAGAAFVQWRSGLERRLRAFGGNPTLEAHFAKYRKLAPALALLWHLMSPFNEDGFVSLEAVQAALRFAT